MAELVDSIARRIRESGEIHLNARVSSLNRSPGPAGEFSLAFATEQGTSTHANAFDAVIVALPADRAAGLVWPLDSQLGDALGQIEYASSAIVCTGHRLADIAHPLDASGLVVPAVEGRRILSVSFASRKFAGRAPEGSVVLRTFLGGASKATCWPTRTTNSFGSHSLSCPTFSECAANLVSQFCPVTSGPCRSTTSAIWTACDKSSR